MTVLLAAPILLTLTLLVSGLAKLGARQGTEDAMTSLRLPMRSSHRTIATVLPISEILLALLLWIPIVPLQVTAAVVTAALLLAYLAIIARALTFEEEVECSCFGTLASPTVSASTLGRNIVLSLLGLLTVAVAADGLMADTVAQEPLTVLGIGAALLVTVALTALTLGGADAADAPDPAAGTTGIGHGDWEHAGSAESAEDEDLLDYERASIPAAVIQHADGRLATLSQLTAHRAALLVFVSEGCGPCERVLDHAERWIADLAPFMQVYFVFAIPLAHRRERTLERVGDHALHDLQFTARRALGATGAPSAVLLGADGLLAGGPVTGGSEVIRFAEEILEQLAAAQEDGELGT